MELTLQNLQNLMKEFVVKRGWEDRYRKPKDIALSISVEVGELLEIFQWLDERQLKAFLKTRKRHIENELADIILYCINLSNALDIDLNRAITKKMKTNELKYPSKSRE